MLLNRWIVHLSIVVLAFLFSISFVKSQGVHVDWHTVKQEEGQVLHTFNDKAGNLYIITESKDIYIGMKPFARNSKQVGRKHFIDKYSPDMTHAYRKDFDLTPTGYDQKAVLIDLKSYPADDGAVLMNIFYIKSEDKLALYACKVTPDGTFSVANKKLAETEASNQDDIKTGFAISPDNGRIAAYVTASKGKDGYKLSAASMTLADMKSAPAVVVTLPVPPKDFDIENMAVSNGGEMAFGLQSVETSTVFLYNKSLKSATVTVGDKYVYSKSVYFAGDELVAAGLYSAKKGRKDEFTDVVGNNPDGLVYERFNIKTCTSLGHKEVPLEGPQQYKQVDLSNTRVTDAVALSNGSHVLICEQHTSFTTHQGTEIITNSVHGPMHLICVKADGSFEWYCSISKRQISWASYALLFQNDNIYIAYNDQPSNVNTTPRDISYLTYESNTCIVLAKVDKNGTISKSTLGNSDGKAVYMDSKIYTPTSTEKAVFYTFDRKDRLNAAEEIKLVSVELP